MEHKEIDSADPDSESLKHCIDLAVLNESAREPAMETFIICVRVMKGECSYYKEILKKDSPEYNKFLIVKNSFIEAYCKKLNDISVENWDLSNILAEISESSPLGKLIDLRRRDPRGFFEPIDTTGRTRIENEIRAKDMAVKKQVEARPKGELEMNPIPPKSQV